MYITLALTYALFFQGIPHVPRTTSGSIYATTMIQSALYTNIHINVSCESFVLINNFYLSQLFVEFFPKRPRTVTVAMHNVNTVSILTFSCGFNKIQFLEALGLLFDLMCPFPCIIQF